MWEDLRDYKIIEGDCIAKMQELESCSIDAIVTDPPYGIGFMNKKWDCSVPGLDWARECLRVLRPGGHIIAFSSTRTVHRLGVAIEDAGFEIRDTIHWCYFSGFPKSRDIDKDLDCDDWEGYGTALKPAIEPAILARKPIEKGLTIAQNVLKYGTGAINIDDCRFAYGNPCWVGDSTAPPSVPQPIFKDHAGRTYGYGSGFGRTGEYIQPNNLGRWPANLYQCAKPSRAEREAGLDHLKRRTAKSNMNTHNGHGERFDGSPTAEYANFHPTVKPIKLMRWLCRLIGGQKGSIILDTFCGSGTTGCAAILEGFDFLGIEITSEYLPIIEGRLDWAKEEYKRENAQLDLFEGAV
jgi:DNA modification methylase